MQRYRYALVLTLLVTTVLLVPRVASAEPGDQYAVSILTMGPGDMIFFKFGHNALVVRNKATSRTDVYNWGTFSFDEPGLITKFIQGKLTYWLSVQGFRGTVRQYQAEQRTMVEQELALSPQQKLELVRMVETNALPQNRSYQYDYYLDNCSTRVRDVIDKAAGGQLKAASGGPATMTFRQETLRLTADVWWGYILLDLAMGKFIDQPITEWEQMFVPGKLEQMLRRATTINQAGERIPLVQNERILLTAERAPELTSPPRRVAYLLTLGVLVGGLFGVLSYRVLSKRQQDKSSWWLRTLFGSLVFLYAIAIGIVGSLMLFFCVGTNHAVTYWNENLLLANPIAVVLAISAIGVAARKRWAHKPFLVTSLCLGAMAVVAVLFKAMPFWFKQQNGNMLALFVPIWLGLGIASYLSSKLSRTV